MRISLLVTLLALSAATRAGELSIVHHETARDWQFRQAAPGEPYSTVRFNALGRQFDLELATNRRLISQLERTGYTPGPGQLTLYAGRITGEPGSWLRLAFTGENWQGLIWDGNELYAVESAAALDGLTELPVDSAADLPVLFRAADLRIAPGSMSCLLASADASAVISGKSSYETLVQELKTAPDQLIDIAVLADRDFSVRHATDPEAALAARLNNIDGIFAEQVGVMLNITEFRVFDVTDDPLTDSTDPSTLLEELGRYKFEEPALQPLGLVHLYTGRDLDGSAAGVAYIGGICRSRFGSGLSEGRRTVFTDSLVGAHEIGHIFGAPHDGEAGSPCESTPETFLMAPSINGSSEFSACSLEEIGRQIAAAPCLKPVAAADMAVDLTGLPATVLDGADFDLEVNARNLGSDIGSGVQLLIGLPPALSLIDPGERCVAAAGGAECSLGSVAPGSLVAVALSLRAQASGAATIRAEVSADADLDPANDVVTVIVDVEPSADLAIELQAPATLTQGTITDIGIRIDNLSTTAGTSLLLDVDLPDFLQTDSVSIDAGACSGTIGPISCSADSLAGGGSLTVTLGVSATQSGSGDIIATVSAAEGDPDTSNNEATRTLRVRQVDAPASSSGGGGGVGAGLLLLVSGGLWRQSRRRQRI